MDRSIRVLARAAINLAALFIFIVGAIFRVDQMFLMALALALLPAAAWAIGWALCGGVACSRQMPTTCAAGETVPVTVTVTNTARLSRPALQVIDVLPPGLKLQSSFAGLVLNLRHEEERQITYWLKAERRGRYHLSLLRLESTDPLGFYLFSQRCHVSSEIAVYPTLLPLRRVFWEDAPVRGGQSLDASQRRGTGLDFHGVREYYPGDELRSVHWRTTARTGKLAVTEYSQGSSLAITVVLDLSRTAYARFGDEREAALDCAVTAAASLCAYFIQRGSRVQLLTTTDAEGLVPPSAGNPALWQILETLVDANAVSDVSLAIMLRRMATRSDFTQTLVCITPEEREALLGTGVEALLNMRVIGLQIDTKQHPAASPTSLFWRVFTRGDDLIQVLEGS